MLLRKKEQTPLDVDELQALAGLWRVELDLDDGKQAMTVNLDASGRLQTTSETSGHGTGGLRWGARAVEGEEGVTVRLRVGVLSLVGEGERKDGGLRCSAVHGRVTEGTDDPTYVGEFRMRLVTPATDEAGLPALAASHQSRVDARRAPPARFQRDGFVGRWHLLINFEGDATAVVPLRLSASGNRFGSFVSEVGERGPYLGGTWGVWSPRPTKRDTTVLQAGSHLWLRVNRDKSTSTLRGIGDLPVRESFSLWGRPVLGSVEAELSSRTEEGAARVDRCDGNVFFGTSSDREYVLAGSFTLMRNEPLDEEVERL